MTDADERTVRAWCAANGVTVRQMWPNGPWEYCETNLEATRNLPPMTRDTESDLDAAIWEQVGPWIQSARNMDAVEVERLRARVAELEGIVSAAEDMFEAADNYCENWQPDCDLGDALETAMKNYELSKVAKGVAGE